MQPMQDVGDRETYEIVAAALAVHRTMGGGLLESPYTRALEIEFRGRDIPYVREPAIELVYQGLPIGCYRPDFLCHDSVIVEVKATETLIPQHYAQVMHYLMAQGATRALLINCGLGKLRWKRFSRPSQPSEAPRG
jgi:GxxExxY protein